MDIDKLIANDIKDSIQQLRFFRQWLELNIENLSLSEWKKIRAEVERLEICIEINKQTV